MKISQKDYAKIILKASEKGVNAKELAPVLWHSLYQSKSLNKLDNIINLAEKMLADKNNELSIAISSATDLSSEQILDISRELESRYHKKIIAEFKIEPELGSGIKITTDDKILDYSSQYQIENLIKHINT